MMQPGRALLQRCVAGALHRSPVVLAAAAAATTTASGRRGGRGGATTDAEAAEAARRGEVDGRRRQRRTPAQLLGDLSVPGTSVGDGEDINAEAETAAAAAATRPIARLLRKHDVRHSGTSNKGGDVDYQDSSSSNSGGAAALGGKSKNGKLSSAAMPEPGRARARVKVDRLIAPPTAAEADDVRPQTGGGSGGIDDGDGTSDFLTISPSESASTQQQQQPQQQLLTNPFRGLHADVARSYRIDQLLDEATAGDLLFARQEKKSTAFSFLHFRAGERFYASHWSCVHDMQQQLDASADAAVAQQERQLRALSKRLAAPYTRGTPIPGLTLFNNDLGLQNAQVQCSYPLIVAQRLLLFPDHLRHFHAVCGRPDVPCDFYADVDLPGETVAGAEKTLLEILNYLDVRLPGVGFTDPFFLVLTNAVPSADKVSYHIHVRSMTHVSAAAAAVAGGAAGKKSTKARRKPASKKIKDGAKKNKKEHQSAIDRELDEDEEVEEPYDDLTDMVNAVDGGASSGGRHSAPTPKVVAFQDYRAVKILGDEVNQLLGRDAIDHNCYRPNGLLRCAFSAKLPSAQSHEYRSATDKASMQQQHLRKRLVPLVTASDPALQQRLSEMEAVLRTMSDPEIMELTFCTRHLDLDAKAIKAAHQHATELTVLDSHAPEGSAEQQRRAATLLATTRHRFKLIRPRHVLGPQASQAAEYDAYGNLVSPFLTEAAKWRRFKAVTAKLRTLPPRAAESYDVWVRVGLALHNFSNEDHVFDEWVLFSLKSPLKYSREVCRKKWVQFERNPDALNWRRGYNYLNSTVWRQV